MMQTKKQRPVYLDYAAATPTDPRVIKVMTACLSIEGTFGNPHAKDHVYGWEAAEAVEKAREQVASLVGASPLEIIFTSGATESNNIAILGLYRALKRGGDRRRHIITSKIEHKAVLEACGLLAEDGCSVTFLDPQSDGSITPEQVEDALTPDTFLVSVAQANSVLGTVSDVENIAALCRGKNVYFHTDAAQSAGYIPLKLSESSISMCSLTSEKVCGPKGAGALFINRSQKVPLAGLIYGGGQERGLRGGTVATHEVAGMGEAFAILKKQGAEDAKRMNALCDMLLKGISDLPGIIVNGSAEHRLPGILSVSFKDIDGSMLLPSLNDTAASQGSACSSKDLTPSYVLTAIGRSEAEARASLRLSLGRFTSEEEIKRAVADIRQAVLKLRAKAHK